MPDKTIISYIQSQLNQGYNLNSIRAQLLKYNYPQKRIDDAIDYIYRNKQTHTFHISKASAVVLVAVFLGISIIIASIFIFLAPEEEKEVLLDLELDPITTSVEPGQLLEFKIQLFNIGAKKRFDAHLTHTITDNTGNLVTSIEEELGVITRAAKTTRIRIPLDTKNGDYNLKTIANYEGKTASASFTFNIYQERIPTCFDDIKNQGEEDVDCGGPCRTECEEEEPEPILDNETEPVQDNETQPTPDNETQEPEPPEDDQDTFDQDMQNILNLVEQDRQAALQECLDMTGADKDQCINLIALDLNNHKLCKSIEDEFKSDSCIMNIAINTKDYSNCDSISNTNLRESCSLLQQ